MKRLNIVKIGGKVLADPLKLELTLKSFSAIEGMKILVHGGGSEATTLANRLGTEVKMVEGRRITDEKMLDIAIMVYAGLLNKKVVARLQYLEVNALGMSGADGNIILSKKRAVNKIDYGHVGDVEKVNVENLERLLVCGFVPVICALTHDGQGNILNTNADSIAAQIAQSLTKNYNVHLSYAFELKGVLSDFSDKQSVIAKINNEDFERMRASGTINEGMIPKVYNALHASKKGVQNVFICNYASLHNPQEGSEICTV